MMAEKKNKAHDNVGNVQNRASNISLAPLTTGQAMAALLKVTPKQIEDVEAADKKAKVKRKA